MLWFTAPLNIRNVSSYIKKKIIPISHADLYDSLEKKTYLLKHVDFVFWKSSFVGDGHGLKSGMDVDEYAPVMWPSNGVLPVNPVSLE